MHKDPSKRTCSPAWAIVVLMGASIGILNILQIYSLRDIYPISKMMIGQDYRSIYLGTELLMDGFSPNVIEFYCYPPTAALLNYPLWLFDINFAQKFIYFFYIAITVWAYTLVNCSFENSTWQNGENTLLAGLFIIVLSYPFYFLIARGHLTGIVILFLAMGIYLHSRNNSFSSVCFGMSISLIVFPVLLLVPLLLFRRYKIFFYTMLTILALFLCCPGLWFDYIEKGISARTGGWYLVQENCSITNTFLFFGIAINKVCSSLGLPHFNSVFERLSSRIITVSSLATYGAMFLAMAIADLQIRKKSPRWNVGIETALLMMYIPFMIAIPVVSFQYNLVLIILLVPVLYFLTHNLHKPLPKTILWVFISGLFCSQFQAHSFQQMVNPGYQFFHFFPAFGLFLVMTGCVAFKLWFWRRYEA